MSDRLKFEERSDWHYHKFYGLRALLNQLRFEGKREDEVSAGWRQLTEEMEKAWPQFGKGQEADKRAGTVR